MDNPTRRRARTAESSHILIEYNVEMEFETMDVEKEMVDALVIEINRTLNEAIYMASNGYRPKIETWIEKGSSPFPNQDRMWGVSWVDKNGHECMVETW